MRSKSILGTLLATSALGLSLAGCRLDDRRLAAADTAWPATLAAPNQGPIQDRYGPPPQRIPVGRLATYDDGWAWADRSYALDRAFYDTPPDYGFYYDNDEPWVWQTSDRWAMYGDPYADDAWRYYYYQPGAVRPYFIRDDRYGYGYDDAGRLVAMFDLLGRLLPQTDLYRYEDPAGRYYQRAYLMRQASLRAQPVVVTREVWLNQAPIIQRSTNVWINAAQQQPDWVRYRERTGDRFVRAFDDERRRRAPSLTTAQVAPDQRRGFFGRPVSAPQPQAAGIEPDRRGLPGRLDQADRRAEPLAPKPLRQAEAQAQRQQRDQQRQVEAQAQKQPHDQQRRAEAQAQQKHDRQQQAEAQAQRQQRDQQRQVEAQAQKQQHDQQRRAEAQAQQKHDRQQQAEAQAQAQRQQHDRQQQAEAQAQTQQHDRQQRAAAQVQKQQHDRQQQAQAQVQKQQHDQQQQAQAQAQKQEHDRQQQAEAQVQRQQHDRQQQAEAQAQKQQHDQQQQAQAQQAQAQQAQAQQAQAQQAQKQQAQKQQAEKQRGQKQEAQATDQTSKDQGKGRGHKG